MAMANSVEARHPFLDYRVVEFASKLPPHLKMKALNEKYILKKAFEPIIPPNIAKRPKQPYRAPEARCFFAPAVRDYFEDLLSTDRIRSSGIFNPRAVQQLARKVRSNAAIGVKDNMALVSIASTQILVDQFLSTNGGAQYDHRAAATAVCK
jgi:asparagine synthase (glutamine-hydrolysing)